MFNYFAASRAALRALILRDLAVLKKNFAAFVARTVIQPFLLVFVFLYVFPLIGQGVGGGARSGDGQFQLGSCLGQVRCRGPGGCSKRR